MTATRTAASIPANCSVAVLPADRAVASAPGRDSVPPSNAVVMDPVVIDPDATVEMAARVMADRKIGCLPVLNPEGTLVGMLTETDVLRYFAGRLS